jgi:capsular exopolysaccharide synthesis family protein
MQELLYGDPTNGRRTSQLHDLLRTLWNGKWIILGVMVLTVAAAGAYTYSIPTKYRTSSLLLVDRDGQGTSLLSELGGRSSQFSQQRQTLRNELLILRQSRTIPNRVARKLQEMETHPRTGAPLQILRGPQGDPRTQAQIAGRIQGMIRAQPSGEETDGLYVSATGAKPRETALVVNLYAEEYIRRTKEKSRADLTASREFLEEQADTLKAEVRAAERRLQEYMSEKQAVSLDQETGRIVKRISDLESRRAELRIEIDMKRASMEARKDELEQIEPKLADRLSSSLEERLSQAQQDEAELQSKIERIEQENPDLQAGSPLYRNLQRLKERASTLERRTDSLATRYVNEALSAGGVAAGTSEEGTRGKGVGYVAEQRRGLAQSRIELNGLQARLDVLNERLRENRQKLEQIPTQSIKLAQLQRERRSTEQIYSFVQEKLQEARLAEQSEIGYAEIIRSAAPGRPVGPDTRRNLLLGLMLGLVAGGGLVVLREQLDTRIYQPDDLREHGHHVLGVVPSMTPLIDDEFGGQETIEIDGRPVNTLLAMLVSPMSAAAEAYRRIRTNLRFAKPDDDLQTMAVSSADKGDGKTTTCANLALALASAGKRTIVVDADLRRPWMHEMLNVDRDLGLSQVLYEGELDPEAYATEVENLFVIPAGDTVPNPAELLGSNRMKEFVEALEAKFDYVLIDTPPALLFSDVLGLAPRCDGTLLVVAAGETDGRAFDHAAEMLADVEADVAGAVLNQFDASSSVLQSYGYNYGYAYSYRRLYEYYRDGDKGAPEPSGIRAWWGG